MQKLISTRGHVLVELRRPGTDTEPDWFGRRPPAIHSSPPETDSAWVHAINDHDQVLMSSRETTYLLDAGEFRVLPNARQGFRTHYRGLANRGWLTGYVEVVRPGDVRPSCQRGLVARPYR